MLDKVQFGGAEFVALTYKQTQVELGHQAIAVGLYNHKTPIGFDYVFDNKYEYLTSIRKLIIQSNLDCILIAHTSNTLAIAALAKFSCSKKVKIIFVQHLKFSEKKMLALSLAQYLIDKYIQITPVTSQLVNKYIRHEKLFYLNNYLGNFELTQSDENSKYQAKRIEKSAKDRTIITFVGAMRKKGKNASHIFELAKRLASDKYFFVVVGDGSGAELDAFKNALYTYEEKNMLWLGYQNNVIPILEKSDYLFFPSTLDEMMPMTVLEGLITDNKIIAYRNQACEHLLDESNLFEALAFDDIIDAIVQETVFEVKLPFDENYGRDKWIKLLQNI